MVGAKARIGYEDKNAKATFVTSICFVCHNEKTGIVSTYLSYLLAISP